MIQPNSVYTNVLYNASSTSVYSPVFRVWPGYVALLSVYGLMNTFETINGKAHQKACILVQKVVVVSQGLQRSESCKVDLQAAIEDIPRDQISHSEDVMQCAPWALGACDNLKAISVPGTYQLELTDESQIGEIYVELTTYPASEALMLPPGLLFGY